MAWPPDDDDDTGLPYDSSGASPWVQALRQAFSVPVERLGDVAPQLMAANLPGQNDAPPAPTNQGPPSGVNWGFIADREGTRPEGYVPKDNSKRPLANSGVTVAHGFDLGGRSVGDLQRLGLPDDIGSLLAPYVGLRGQAAQDLLDAHPLPVSPQQQNQIDNAVYTSNYNSVAAAYNAQTAAGTRFQDLPQDAQTAIMDLAHQYGPNLAVRTPNFWNQIVNGQWQAAQDNLMNFGDLYERRRLREAGLMQNAIVSGALPNLNPPAPRPRPDE